MKERGTGRAEGEKKRSQGAIAGILRAALYLLILGVLVLLLDLTFRNKGVENASYSAVSTAAGFYQQKRDSVDVLFLGSSNTYCAFSPVRLEETTGLSAYNLASSQQSLLTSYWWLREALRYQKPEAVVLDTYYLFFSLGNEGSVRKAFDWMRLSSVKAEAVAELSALDPETFPEESFYFPLMRYHTRWKEITREELFGAKSWLQLAHRTSYRGYCPRDEEIGGAEEDQGTASYSGSAFTPLEEDGSVPYTSLETDDGEPTSQMEKAKITDLARDYTDRIAALCRENGIRLILVKTPISWWSMKEHEAVEALADKEGVPFVDLNMSAAIRAMDYHYGEDAADHLHANRKGAVKITDYMGRILLEELSGES